MDYKAIESDTPFITNDTVFFLSHFVRRMGDSPNIYTVDIDEGKGNEVAATLRQLAKNMS